MAFGDQALIREIEEGALNEAASVASVLRKCIALGGRAGSTKLRDWARYELNGYEKKADTPSYRIVPALIQIDAIAGFTKISGQTLGPHQLPDVAQDEIKEEVALTSGIAQIEEMARPGSGGDHDTVRLSLPGATLLMSIMNSQMDEFQQITALYWAVNKVHIKGVVDRVRTTCVEFVAELRASLPNDAKHASREVVDDALTIAVTGKRNVVHVVQAQASAEASQVNVGSNREEPPGSWWSRWRNRGIVVGIATVVAAITGIAALLGWKPW